MFLSVFDCIDLILFFQFDGSVETIWPPAPLLLNFFEELAF